MEIDGGIGVGCDDVTIRNNYVNVKCDDKFNINANNAVVTQNYLARSYSVSSYPLYIESGYNLVISNNYILYLYSKNVGSSIICNNILEGDTRIYNAQFYNNIMTGGTFTQTSANVYNNIGDGQQFGTENGNQSDADMAAVFLNTGSTDGKWQLRSNSPALGAGAEDEDCGMFGGTSPYKLSGIPQVPNIYYYSSPTTGSAASGLPVTIRVKSN